MSCATLFSTLLGLQCCSLCVCSLPLYCALYCALYWALCCALYCVLHCALRCLSFAQDRMIVSCSWDRSVHVYSDLQQTELPLLRRILKAHDTDIVSLAVSRPLSLMATGGEDGIIRLWDFQVRYFESYF